MFQIKKIVIIILVFVVFKLPLEKAEGVTVTLQDCEDTYINAKSPESNYGNSVSFWLNDADNKRPLLKFDLSSIPRTAHITKAELSLYAALHDGHQDSLDPFIMPVLESWTEDGATWNTRDGTIPWSAAGGYFDSLEFCFFPSAMSPNLVNVWYIANIISLLQYWVDGSLPNYGVLLSAFRTGSSTRYRFVSSEVPEYFRPKLEIIYTDNGTLTLPDTLVHPEIIRRADSHVYQHIDQDRAMTLNDMEELGAKVFWVPNKSLNFDWLDPWIDDACSRGMTVIFTIPLSKSVDGVYEHAKTTAAHFKGRVQWYNAHGEVNNTWYQAHLEEYSPEVITGKVKAIYDAVKSEDPDAKICLAQLGTVKPMEYIQECLEYGLANSTEMWGYGQAFNVHQSIDYMDLYRYNSRFVRLAQEKGAEVGHTISVQMEGMISLSDTGTIQQAKKIARKTLLSQYIGMLPNEWYKLYDPSTENYQIVSDDYQTKYEGFYALKYLNQYLDPSRYAPIHMGIMTNPTNFYKFAFKASNTDVVLALWDANKAPTNSFDPGTNADVTFLDYGLSPVQIVDPISGEVVDSAPAYTAEVGKVTIKNVEIRDYPRLIILKGGRTPTKAYGKPDEGTTTVDDIKIAVFVKEGFESKLGENTVLGKPHVYVNPINNRRFTVEVTVRKKTAEVQNIARELEERLERRNLSVTISLKEAQTEARE